MVREYMTELYEPAHSAAHPRCATSDYSLVRDKARWNAAHPRGVGPRALRGSRARPRRYGDQRQAGAGARGHRPGGADAARTCAWKW